jgi:predicted metal-binding protein
MKRIGIIICARYQNCGGGKCLRAMQERCGGFSAYPKEEAIQLVGYSTCGGCPGGNVEYVPEEFLKNGCDVVHLATGLVVGYPPCPYVKQFKEFIETRYSLPVVVGTHPIPLTYFNNHQRLSSWQEQPMEAIAPLLFAEAESVMAAYN